MDFNDMVPGLQPQQQDQPSINAAMTHLQSHVKASGDHWVMVQCGNWEEHPLGWQGPAVAVLQLWRLGQSQEFDYNVYVVDPTGLPTGGTYSGLRGRCTNSAGY